MYPGKDELLRCILKDEAPRAISDFLEKKRKTYRHNALFPPNRTVQELAAHIAAKLFPSVRSALAGLVRLGYSLAVASLTDEENIKPSKLSTSLVLILLLERTNTRIVSSAITWLRRSIS